MSVGACLKDDDILMAIETQKATEELPCGESGYLRALLVAEGDEVNVHDALAVLTDEPGEDFEIPEPEKATEREKTGPAQAVETAQQVEERSGPGKSSIGSGGSEARQGFGRRPYEGGGYGPRRTDHGGGRRESRRIRSRAADAGDGHG